MEGGPGHHVNNNIRILWEFYRHYWWDHTHYLNFKITNSLKAGSKMKIWYKMYSVIAHNIYLLHIIFHQNTCRNGLKMDQNNIRIRTQYWWQIRILWSNFRDSMFNSCIHMKSIDKYFYNCKIFQKNNCTNSMIMDYFSAVW